MWVRRFIALTLFALPFGACGGRSVYTEGGEAGSGSQCEDTLCGEECVDLSSDARHCGSCFDACAGAERCSGGRCVEMRCDPPTVWCAGNGCADLRVSNENCGTCGNVCAPGTSCSGGRCMQQCPSGQCGGTCVDFSSDPRNCGGCGFACAPDQYCSGGVCTQLCPGGTLCPNGCADLGADRENCGACGNRCIGDELACVGGICQVACPPGLVYCNGACIDWRTDAAHCGGCNNACPGDSLCIDAICQAFCPTGTWCDGICVDFSSDAKHCGQCFASCPATYQCAGGRCVSGKCGDGRLEPAEEGDPPPGPAPIVPLDPLTCRYDFSRINQWYCHEACGNWGGSKGCDQLDADAFCKLKMDNPNSTAIGWRTMRAMEAPGVCCPAPTFEPGSLGCTSLGVLSSRGVGLAVSVHPTNLFSTHQGGTVITDLVCTDP